jgi:hypothetical protein
MDSMTDEQTKTNSDITTTTEENQIVELTDRKTLHYSSSDLNILEQNFFSMNEGVDDILSLMDDMNKKEEDVAKWKEERSTLTLDWKRKHKYDQSKRSKKMRFR